MKALEFTSAMCNGPLLVLDYAREPEHADHSRMWIDLGNRSFPGMNLPAGGKSKASKLPEYTWGTWALGGICGVACGVLAMEKPVRQAIDRTGATSVWTDNGSVDCDKRSCFIGEVPL